MKNWIIITLCLAPVYVFSQTLFIDDFIYDAKDSIEGSGNWFRDGVNAKFNIKIASPGLEYKDYSGSGKGNCVQISNDGNGDVVGHRLSKNIDSGSVYVSFLLRADSLSDKFREGSLIALNPPTSTFFNTILYVKKIDNNNFSLGVIKVGPPAYSNEVYHTHQTYLVVLKYSFIAGVDNDVCSIYVFNNGVPKTEPAKSLAELDQGADQYAQGYIYLSNNYAETFLVGCDFKIDGIRVGTSWENSVHAVVSGIKDNPTRNTIQTSISPNPAYDETTIQFVLNTRSNVEIEIVNSFGASMEKTNLGVLDAGSDQYHWDAKEFPAGIYFCKIKIKNQQKIHKLILVK